MMHFPLFKIFPPYFRNISQTPLKNFQTLMTLFSNEFEISPYFRPFAPIPPISTKSFIPPAFPNSTPYFYHDAFMHHTMHVLNASGREQSNVTPIGLQYTFALILPKQAGHR